jgi:hypothetical protein
MKGSKLGLLVLIVGALSLLSASRVFAQGGTAPSGQLGIGIGTNGAEIIYALSPGFFIGANAALIIQSGDNGQTSLEIGPFARMLFEGTVNPFIQAGISISKVGEGDANTSLYAAFGLEYFVSRNIGVYGMLPILDVPFKSGSAITVGINNFGAVGVEWFFNP